MIYRNVCLTLLLTLLFLTPAMNALALFDGDELVTINGAEFTPEDYRHWWREWREPGMDLLETPDKFIDWLLLAQEASDMQLQDNPSYKKKLEVFLKVRALMHLKAEEVDARKTIPTSEELWEAYKKAYVPILNLRMLAVNEEEQANVIKSFLDRGVALEQVADAAGLKNVAEQVDTTGPLRYTRVPPTLQGLALELKPGEAGGPAKFGHAWYFIEVLDRNEGNQADFEAIKQKLIGEALKQQEEELTYQLVQNLKEEYQVQVDEEVIAAIGEGGVDDELGQQLAVKIGQLEVTARFIYEAATKSRRVAGHAGQFGEDFTGAKNRVVNDLLVQTLTGMEALARNFEAVPPLKHTYDFYKKHRLIRELEATVIHPQIQITDADIEAYYQAHPEKYSRAGLVELAVVKTTEYALAEQLIQRIKAGEDYFQVVEPISPAGIQVIKTPLEHLTPVVRAEVEKLANGQVSTGVRDGENLLFIKLVRKGAREMKPLDGLKKQIAIELRAELFKEQRDAIVQQLRDRSTIKLNRSVWKKLNKKLHEDEKRHES